MPKSQACSMTKEIAKHYVSYTHINSKHCPTLLVHCMYCIHCANQILIESLKNGFSPVSSVLLKHDLIKNKLILQHQDLFSKTLQSLQIIGNYVNTSPKIFVVYLQLITIFYMSANYTNHMAWVILAKVKLFHPIQHNRELFESMFDFKYKLYMPLSRDGQNAMWKEFSVGVAKIGMKMGMFNQHMVNKKLFTHDKQTELTLKNSLQMFRKDEKNIFAHIEDFEFVPLGYKLGQKMNIGCGNSKCKKKYLCDKYGLVLEANAEGTVPFHVWKNYDRKITTVVNKWYICGGCKLIRFCSRKCQKYSWNRQHHKHQCDFFKVLFLHIQIESASM
eukprot:188293_1